MTQQMKSQQWGASRAMRSIIVGNCVLFSLFYLLCIRNKGSISCPMQRLAAAQPPAQPHQFEVVVPPIPPEASRNVTLPSLAALVLQNEREGKGPKIISMSLFGSDPRYTTGIVANALLVMRDWKGWTLRVYYGEGVPDQILNILKSMDVELVHITSNQKGIACMYWRYVLEAAQRYSSGGVHGPSAECRVLSPLFAQGEAVGICLCIIVIKVIVAPNTRFGGVAGACCLWHAGSGAHWRQNWLLTVVCHAEECEVKTACGEV